MQNLVSLSHKAMNNVYSSLPYRMPSRYIPHPQARNHNLVCLSATSRYHCVAGDGGAGLCTWPSSSPASSQFLYLRPLTGRWLRFMYTNVAAMYTSTPLQYVHSSLYQSLFSFHDQLMSLYIADSLTPPLSRGMQAASAATAVINDTAWEHDGHLAPSAGIHRSVELLRGWVRTTVIFCCNRWVCAFTAWNAFWQCCWPTFIRAVVDDQEALDPICSECILMSHRVLQHARVA